MCNVCNAAAAKTSVTNRGANPAIVRYNTRVVKIYNISKCTKFTKIYIVKIYNVSNSLARFRIKLVLALACYSSGVVVENSGAYDRELQRQE
jgi:hypothetical protein